MPIGCGEEQHDLWWGRWAEQNCTSDESGGDNRDVCPWMNRLTTQLGKLVSICSMVLFNGTNKKVKCNMVIDWFATNYMGAIMLLFLAVSEVLFWCLQIAKVSSVVGGCLWPWSETRVGNSFASFGENPAGCYFLQLHNAELICSQVCLPMEAELERTSEKSLITNHIT